LRYQIDSRLILENLLKFMIDQQISLSNKKPSGECRFCPLVGNCGLCSKAGEHTRKLLSSLHRVDLPSKINQTFHSYNANLVQHLKQAYCCQDLQANTWTF